MRPSVTADQIATHVLRSGETEISVLSVGCAVMRWTVGKVPVVLGYADPVAYINNPVSMGVVIGRVVNRISQARVTVEGRDYLLSQNHGDHTIHGGAGGFGWRNWDMQPVNDREVILSLVSEDGDQGFPGRVAVQVTLRLDGYCLSYDMIAQADNATLINMAQHHYFNLMGQGDVMDHSLQILADHYTPTGPDYRPTGQIAPVAGTRYDYRTARRLGDADPGRLGCDASLILKGGEGPQIRLRAPNGLELCMTTDRPCVQLYTSGGLGSVVPAGPGAAHKPFGAVCLEAQDYPDAQAQGFSHTMYGPGVAYRQRTTIEIRPT